MHTTPLKLMTYSDALIYTIYKYSTQLSRTCTSGSIGMCSTLGIGSIEPTAGGHYDAADEKACGLNKVS